MYFLKGNWPQGGKCGGRVWVFFHKNFRFCKTSRELSECFFGTPETFGGPETAFQVEFGWKNSKKVLSLVPKGSKPTFHKGIGQKEANVLGRYGYSFTKITDFVKPLESFLKILFGTLGTCGGPETAFQVKFGWKKSFPLSQRAQNALFTRELAIRRQMCWEGMGVFHKKIRFCKTSRELSKNNFGDPGNVWGAQKPSFKWKLAEKRLPTPLTKSAA